METPLFLCVLIVLVLLVVLINKIDSIAKNQKRLGNEIAELRKSITNMVNGVAAREQTKSSTPNPLVAIPQEHTMQSPSIPPPKISQKSGAQIPEKNENFYREISNEKKKNEIPLAKEKKATDWEKFVGENILSKIGIVVLVLGLGFFVKFAIDNNWIGIVGRVLVGFACGGILLGIGYRMREKYKDFSAVLAGGGFAAFYLTVTIAYQIYHIFNQPLAFSLTVLITAFSVAFALLYDRQELAIFSLVGGFASPFMVSSGGGSYLILFSYITILDLGMLALAYFKRWRWVNFFDYIGTLLILFTWLFVRPGTIPFRGTLFFCTIFYLIFFLMNMVYNLKLNQKFKAGEITMLLSNVFIYFSLGYWLLGNFAVSYRGAFTLGIAILNFVPAWLFYKHENADKNLLYLLVGIVLTFVCLAGPIQLNGHHITLFWSAESVLLIWLFLKSKMPLLKHTSALMWMLAILSLLASWYRFYGSLQAETHLHILFNNAVLTSFFSLLAILVYRNQLAKVENESFVLIFETKLFKLISEVVFFILLYSAVMCELRYQLLFYQYPSIQIVSYTGFFNYLFVSALISYLWQQNRGFYVIWVLSLLSVCLYLFYYQHQFSLLRDRLLQTSGAGMFPFYFRYLSIFLLFYICYYLVIVSLVLFSEKGREYKMAVWISAFVLVFASSAELVSLAAQIPHSGAIGSNAVAINDARKIGFPVLWGIFSFIMMFLGMKIGNKQLRIVSLSLFSLTILKLFVFDVWEMSPIGKIISFISLGILLLIVSFLYQKLKRIIIDGEPSNKKDQNL